MPSMTPPQPPPRDRLNIARDVIGAICFIVGLVADGVVLYTITPVACLLYVFTVLTVAGVVLTSGVGR